MGPYVGLVDRTAEAVGPGHPDKFCDHTVAAILQHCLQKDALALVNVECSIDPEAIRLSGVLHIMPGLLKLSFGHIVKQTIEMCGLNPAQSGTPWKIQDKILRFERCIEDDAEKALHEELISVDQVSPTNMVEIVPDEAL